MRWLKHSVKGTICGAYISAIAWTPLPGSLIGSIDREIDPAYHLTLKSCSRRTESIRINKNTAWGDASKTYNRIFRFQFVEGVFCRRSPMR